MALWRSMKAAPTAHTTPPPMTPPGLHTAQTLRPLAHSQTAPRTPTVPPKTSAPMTPPWAVPLDPDSALGRFLREHGFDTVTSVVEGWTPLLRAARLSKTYPQMFSIILQMLSHRSVTPLHLNMGVLDDRPRGWTALHLAVDGAVPLEARSQRVDLVRLLLLARADPMVWREKICVARLSCLEFGVLWALCW